MTKKIERTEKEFFTDAQRDLIAKDLAEKGLGEFQVEQFIMTCERTLLDPFSRQIYARGQSVNKARGNQPDKWVTELVIITGIDGLRAVAERSGEYEGQSPCEWFCADPVKGDNGWQPFWTGKDPQFPEAAKLAVHRKGFKEPMVGVARYFSYVQMTKGYRAQGDKPAKQSEPTQFWRKMPDVMLAKCAEALALRKAFPMLLAGIFLEEEIKDEADLAETETPTVPPTGSIPALPGVNQPAAPPVATPAPEKPADPSPVMPAPEKEKKQRKVSTGAESPPPQEPEKPAATPPANPLPAGGGGWADHVISQITMQDIAGRKVGDLKPEEVKRLKVNWADKYAAKIALNPAKVEEANALKEAFKHHFPNE